MRDPKTSRQIKLGGQRSLCLSLWVIPHNLSMARARYPRPSGNLLHYRCYFQRKSLRQNQWSTFQNLHSRAASLPPPKSENSLTLNQSRLKTSSGGMSMSVSYKTTGLSSLRNRPRRAKPSESPGSQVEDSSAGIPVVVVLYEKFDEPHAFALAANTSKLSHPTAQFSAVYSASL